jgi:pimeloyl-ACP methyl ester carboxylesterase
VSAPVRVSGETSIADGVGPGGALPMYFGSPARRAFGWYHPSTASVARDCVAVICPPIGHEGTNTHRALRHWAERLAAAGIAAIRIDYHGTGDSSGVEDDPKRVRAWVNTIGDAIDFARDRAGALNVALVGIRFGGTLALAAAAERGDVASLILWAAPPTGKAFLREGRAFTRLMGPADAAERPALPGGMEQIGGLLLSAETAAELTAFDPLRSFPGRSRDATALVIPRDDSTSDASFIERLEAAGIVVERRVLDGYEAMMVDAHNSVVPQTAIGATTDWLVSRCAVRARNDARSPALDADDRSMTLAEPTGSAAAASSAMIVERPILFGEGGRLFGILSRPSGEATRRKTGILLLNAGSVYRVGPNRFYVTLARQWAALGYTVIRMDLGGLGDSPAPAGAPENHPYPSHALDDVASGLEALREQGATRVVVAGLCSGAHASFHAGLQLDGIDGVMVVNPIVFYWKPSDALDVGTWVNYTASRYYKKSVRRWGSWLRLFTGKVDLASVARIGMVRGRDVIRAKAGALGRRLSRADRMENAPRDLRRMVSRGTDVFLLFSDGDPGHDYLTLNYRRELRTLERIPGFRLKTIANADHTFTWIDARRRAAAALAEQLITRHS